jgi:hypothetical protein
MQLTPPRATRIALCPETRDTTVHAWGHIAPKRVLAHESWSINLGAAFFLHGPNSGGDETLYALVAGDVETPIFGPLDFCLSNQKHCFPDDKQPLAFRDVHNNLMAAAKLRDIDINFDYSI